MTPKFDIQNSDCITGLNRLADDSVQLTVTSIPFEELFTYSGKVEDVGNNGSTVDIRAGRFAMNLRFLVERLWRVHEPGSNVCVHIQQLLAYKNQHGFMGRRDFRGAVNDVFTVGGEIRGHEIAPDGTVLPFLLPPLGYGCGGFHLIGEFVIPKDPQEMAQKLHLHSLQFKTGYARDSSMLAPAVNDYVLIYHKPGQRKVPVRPLLHKKNPGGWMTTDEWVRDAWGGWWKDINQMDILDGARGHRETDQEKHVCPLQLEVIRRLVRLYTNPGDLVLDPFMGIGSTAFVALDGTSPSTKLSVGAPRNVVGFELKESYHRAAVANAKKALDQLKKRGSAQAAPAMLPCFADEPAGAVA